MILAGLRSLDSVSGSRYYGQLMEKIQAGSSVFLSGRDTMLINLLVCGAAFRGGVVAEWSSRN